MMELLGCGNHQGKSSCALFVRLTDAEAESAVASDGEKAAGSFGEHAEAGCGIFWSRSLV